MSIWTFDYRAHDRFVAPARRAPQIWRLCLGLVLAAALFLAISRFVFSSLFQVMDPDVVDAILSDGQAGQSAASMLVLLFQLGLLAVAAGLVVVMVHKRQPVTLIGDVSLAWRQFIAVLIATTVLTAAVFVLPPYDYGAPLRQNMALGQWLVLLPVAVLAVLCQVSAEEIFFRGYIQQQLAARFRSPLVWMLAPAALFGYGHYLPESAGSNAVTIALWAMMFGMLMADLTARAGTLGPAIAVHFVNNLSALVLVSIQDEMSGLALYVLPFGIADEAQMAAWLPVDFGFMLVSWLAARLAIRV